MAKGKNYRNAAKKLEKDKLYSLDEAVKLAKETSFTKFDATIEAHFKTAIDSKKPEQALRGTLVLPHGTGKTVRIAAIVPESKISEAKAAGADAAGFQDLIEELGKGKISYDVIVATPDVMKSMGKVAKVLGQKGLMPNPKSGTVGEDVAKMIKELKGGRVEYRNDKQGNLHVSVGKASFETDKLLNNVKALLKELRDFKPSGIKGPFLLSMILASSMGPGIKVEVNEALKGL